MQPHKDEVCETNNSGLCGTEMHRSTTTFSSTAPTMSHLCILGHGSKDMTSKCLGHTKHSSLGFHIAATWQSLENEVGPNPHPHTPYNASVALYGAPVTSDPAWYLGATFMMYEHK